MKAKSTSGGDSSTPVAGESGGQEFAPPIREEFRARVLEWARTLNVNASAIYIRPMSRKWASCSTAGTLSFNDELLGIERDLGDYVIVHELLHFSVPNHGKLWKSLMRAHLGDYERLEERLRAKARTSRPRRT